VHDDVLCNEDMHLRVPLGTGETPNILERLEPKVGEQL
jgi:hypothetical protein